MHRLVFISCVSAVTAACLSESTTDVLQLDLTAAEKADLLAFLYAL